MLNNLENQTANTENTRINQSSGTGVAGSLVFLVVMIVFMMILSHFMN